MKKTAIIAVSAIVACIILITQLYEYTDIEVVDSIVESVAKSTGLGVKMVAKKKEAQAEKKVVEIKTEVKPVEKIKPMGPNLDSIAKVEEETKLIALEKEKKKKKLFNLVVDSTVKVSKPKIDCVAVAKPKKKKSLFNGSSNETASSTKDVKKQPIQIFAVIHGSQKVTNDSEVSLRLEKELKTGGETIPARFVFTGKVNVFNNRLDIIVDKIDKVSVSGNIISKDGKGIAVSELSQAGKSYFLSDGQPVTLSLMN